MYFILDVERRRTRRGLSRNMRSMPRLQPYSRPCVHDGNKQQSTGRYLKLCNFAPTPRSCACHWLTASGRSPLCILHCGENEYISVYGRKPIKLMQGYGIRSFRKESNTIDAHLNPHFETRTHASVNAFSTTERCPTVGCIHTSYSIIAAVFSLRLCFHFNVYTETIQQNFGKCVPIMMCNCN